MPANSLIRAVGASAPNDSPDVLLVQNCFIQQLSCNPPLKSRLIRKSAQLGEQLPPEGNELELFLSTPANDPLSIAMLIALIKSWQAEVMNFLRPDGNITPNGPTWRSINGNVASVHNIQPQVSSVVAPVAVAAASGSEGRYALFKQGDYGQTLLGGRTTIADDGCYLCTLVMAATAIGSRTRAWESAGVNVMPEKLTPVLGNRIAIRTGSFSGALISAQQFSRHLGMRFQPYAQGANRPYPNNVRLTSSDLTAVDLHLASGNPIAAGVAYANSGTTHPAHWILIIARSTDGNYIALDPGAGKKITLTKDIRLSLREATSSGDEVILFGHKGNSSDNSKAYGVIRCNFLSPL